MHPGLEEKKCASGAFFLLSICPCMPLNFYLCMGTYGNIRRVQRHKRGKENVAEAGIILPVCMGTKCPFTGAYGLGPCISFSAVTDRKFNVYLWADRYRQMSTHLYWITFDRAMF